MEYRVITADTRRGGDFKGIMSKYARKVDSNQKGIIKELKQYGISIEITSAVGGGACDFFAAYQGETVRVEVKNPETKGKLNEMQSEKFLLWRGKKVVGYCADDVLKVFGLK